MAKIFIHNELFNKEIEGKDSKAACLKLYRTQDSSELSINFNNSIGALPHLERIEACIFDHGSSITATYTYWLNDSLKFTKLCHAFVSGRYDWKNFNL